MYPGLDIKTSPLTQSSLSNNEKGADEYYFYTGRCIPYKKFDLLVDAFNQNGKKLIIATNTDNTLYRNLKAKSNDNIEWKLTGDLDEINRLHAGAKAFLFPPEEDFGLAPIAAMMMGTPVIAYAK
ncbi:MAG: glycosyltransferase [Candidatus Peribacteria bacterium]|nr:MAG: glycosyltransferase [Candidatus Peribacteria bacterium]